MNTLLGFNLIESYPIAAVTTPSFVAVAESSLDLLGEHGEAPRIVHRTDSGFVVEGDFKAVVFGSDGEVRVVDIPDDQPRQHTEDVVQVLRSGDNYRTLVQQEGEQMFSTWQDARNHADSVANKYAIPLCDYTTEGRRRGLHVESIDETSPPGFSGTVTKMKKQMPEKTAFKRAWSMYNKGAKPHVKPEPGKPGYRPPHESVDEGRIIKHPYSVRAHTVGSSTYQTPAAWHVKEYGKPTPENVRRYVEMHNKSIFPGGGNDHLYRAGSDTGLISGATVHHNVSGGAKVAEFHHSAEEVETLRNKLHAAHKTSTHAESNGFLSGRPPGEWRGVAPTTYPDLSKLPPPKIEHPERLFGGKVKVRKSLARIRREVRQGMQNDESVTASIDSAIWEAVNELVAEGKEAPPLDLSPRAIAREVKGHRAGLQFMLGNVHVGTPDDDIRKEVDRRTKKWPKEAEPIKQALLTRALRMHKANRLQYQHVMRPTYRDRMESEGDRDFSAPPTHAELVKEESGYRLELTFADGTIEVLPSPPVRPLQDMSAVTSFCNRNFFDNPKRQSWVSIIKKAISSSECIAESEYEADSIQTGVPPAHDRMRVQMSYQQPAKRSGQTAVAVENTEKGTIDLRVPDMNGDTVYSVNTGPVEGRGEITRTRAFQELRLFAEHRGYVYVGKTYGGGTGDPGPATDERGYPVGDRGRVAAPPADGEYVRESFDDSSKTKFSRLKHGARFEFDHDELKSRGISTNGLANGPWVKTGNKTYKAHGASDGFKGQHTVGSVNIPVVHIKHDYDKSVSEDDWGRRGGYRSSSYGGDPRWIKAKYHGKDQHGNEIKPGDDILYYPNGKKVLAGEHAEQAWRDFQSAKGDEEGRPYAEAVSEGVPEDHQRKIALKTLKLHKSAAGVMGGPDHREAIFILKKHGYSDTALRGMLKQYGHSPEEIESMFVAPRAKGAVGESDSYNHFVQVVDRGPYRKALRPYVFVKGRGTTPYSKNASRFTKEEAERVREALLRDPRSSYKPEDVFVSPIQRHQESVAERIEAPVALNPRAGSADFVFDRQDDAEDFASAVGRVHGVEADEPEEGDDELGDEYHVRVSWEPGDDRVIQPIKLYASRYKGEIYSESDELSAVLRRGYNHAMLPYIEAFDAAVSEARDDDAMRAVEAIFAAADESANFASLSRSQRRRIIESWAPGGRRGPVRYPIVSRQNESNPGESVIGWFAKAPVQEWHDGAVRLSTTKRPANRGAIPDTSDDADARLMQYVDRHVMATAGTNQGIPTVSSAPKKQARRKDYSPLPAGEQSGGAYEFPFESQDFFRLHQRGVRVRETQPGLFETTSINIPSIGNVSIRIVRNDDGFEVQNRSEVAEGFMKWLRGDNDSDDPNKWDRELYGHPGKTTKPEKVAPTGVFGARSASGVRTQTKPDTAAKPENKNPWLESTGPDGTSYHYQKLTPQQFNLGYVERHHPHVSIHKEHNAFIVTRHPDHPAGHGYESTRTLSHARALAHQMSRAGSKASSSAGGNS